MKKFFIKSIVYILVLVMLSLQGFNIGLVICSTDHGDIHLAFVHDGENCSCCMEESGNIPPCPVNGNTYLTNNPDKYCIDTPLAIDKVERTDTGNLHFINDLNNIHYTYFNTETGYPTQPDNTSPVLKIPIAASPEAPLPVIPLRI
ncbi:MAG: hypothetical protein GY863_17350 [bacterium]|nr:hypothetical protein [bacterium]